LRGEEESTDLRTFLADASTIDEQLKAIDGSFSNYLQRKLEFGRQHIKDSAASAVFFHLKVNPNSLGEMLPLLTQVVDSENWINGSSVKRQAIEWLERAQTPEATQVINKHEQRVEQQHIEQQHIEQQRLAEQERLRRENEKERQNKDSRRKLFQNVGLLRHIGNIRILKI